mgnify:CR=1 FL=1
MQKWPLTIANGCFEEGWDDYCHDNIINTHDMLMVRHAGNLIFDVIHFSELQQQVYLSWTVPLPNIFENNATYTQGLYMFSSISYIHFNYHYF